MKSDVSSDKMRWKIKKLNRSSCSQISLLNLFFLYLKCTVTVFDKARFFQSKPQTYRTFSHSLLTGRYLQACWHATIVKSIKYFS